MKTLVVYYSKSGNTRKAAERVRDELSCDCDEILYDEKQRSVGSGLNPADYERVILMCPIWAFHLPEPMSLYLHGQKESIGRYRLAVTCSALGLRGCVSDCSKILGTAPETAVKIRAKLIKTGAYDISKIIS